MGGNPTTLDEVTRRLVSGEIAKALQKQPPSWPLTTMPPDYGYAPPSAALSDSDIRRIAEAVADEMDRREASPVRVTGADVRRWLGGRS